jgi:cobalt-zinc-cadmium efflux system protein
MQCVYALMECVPDEIDIKAVNKTFREVPGVTDLHDLHVWGLSQGKFCLTAHVKCKMVDGAGILQ